MQFFIDHLSKSYEGKPVLKDIDFTFDDSKIYGLLGRNGAGKTTLFNALNRDITVDGGDFGLIRPDGSRGRYCRRISAMCSPHRRCRSSSPPGSS
ncbi:ATP-binding cassette domain-containing protein [Bifidobacterium mongoliense]|uniref:ATP-binding cassette domain-containing protein n=1 Tax=Bifidobacterium mongoliense TaxID=518643 RepID=UPI0019D38E51|nr:ATP-binding cassette domain-containing protein [Bifidobacterium mongoliense]